MSNDNTTSRDCRLLCACGATYGIQWNKPFTANQPYYDAAGFTSRPTIYQGLAGDTSACLIGETQDGIVLAFRGTVMDSKLDWLTDFLAVPMTAKNMPGQVHSGIYLSLQEIIPQIEVTLRGMSEGNNKPLIITGHSKGGGMASLAAMQLLNSYGIKADTVATFASPKIGTKAFATAFDQQFAQTTYENDLDIVPFLPPSRDFAALMKGLPVIGKVFEGFDSWDYEPVGTDMYINADGKVEASNPIIMAERIEQIVQTLAEGKIENIFAAHTYVCGHGYMNGVCQGSGICG